MRVVGGEGGCAPHGEVHGNVSGRLRVAGETINKIGGAILRHGGRRDCDSHIAIIVYDRSRRRARIADVVAGS